MLWFFLHFLFAKLLVFKTFNQVLKWFTVASIIKSKSCIKMRNFLQNFKVKTVCNFENFWVFWSPSNPLKMNHIFSYSLIKVIKNKLPQGFELKPIPGKCCGECVKTKCIVDNKLYEIGQAWLSPDNCTKYECNIKDGQTFISSSMPTCPDINSCPVLLRYKDGCCERCKMETMSQKNCMPESLAESTTVGLIQIHLPPHGTCRNTNGVRGVTECVGTCKSGTKFDPCKLQSWCVSEWIMSKDLYRVCVLGMQLQRKLKSFSIKRRISAEVGFLWGWNAF